MTPDAGPCIASTENVVPARFRKGDGAVRRGDVQAVGAPPCLDDVEVVEGRGAEGAEGGNRVVEPVTGAGEQDEAARADGEGLGDGQLGVGGGLVGGVRAHHGVFVGPRQAAGRHRVEVADERVGRQPRGERVIEAAVGGDDVGADRQRHRPRADRVARHR